jgi:hypothetical protein
MTHTFEPRDYVKFMLVLATDRFRGRLHQCPICDKLVWFCWGHADKHWQSHAPSSPDPALEVISLSWGVQSFGLAAMSALGDLPPVDYAIFADTGWERAETYRFARQWTPWLEERGVRVVRVSASNPPWLEDDHILVPALTIDLETGQEGRLRRQCTRYWKVAPIRRWFSAWLHRHKLGKTPGVVTQWLGYTWEERGRVRDSDAQYVVNRFPFLEMFSHPWTRQRVVWWLQDHDLEVPVKSSCVICPYHTAHGWRAIQMAGNGDWQRAVAVDRAVRLKRPGYLTYLCRDGRPLEAHDYTQQLGFWDGGEK